jgi:hypothetical protein
MEEQMDMSKFNALEKDVWEQCLEYGEGYDNGVAGFMDDLNYSGCQSGMVGSLIYYSDTVKFYDTYEEEIWGLLSEEADNQGVNIFEYLSNLNGADSVGSNDQFKNLLAWWAFEETANLMYGRWENSDEGLEDD